MNTASDIDYARYDHIRPILWTGESLQLLDQRKLPFIVEHVECRDSDAVAEAIHALTVRGAPAIGRRAIVDRVFGHKSICLLSQHMTAPRAWCARCR